MLILDLNNLPSVLPFIQPVLDELVSIVKDDVPVVYKVFDNPRHVLELFIERYMVNIVQPMLQDGINRAKAISSALYLSVLAEMYTAMSAVMTELEALLIR